MYAIVGLLLAGLFLGLYRWYVVRDFRGSRGEVGTEARSQLHTESHRPPPSLPPPST